jgi:hypothetical protein
LTGLNRAPALQLADREIAPRLSELLAQLEAITQEARATLESLQQGEADRS